MRGSPFLLTACFAVLVCGAARGADRSGARPGWFNVFPHLDNYNPTFLPPVVADGKEPSTYRQEARYDWMGDDFRQATAALARDPEFKTQHAAEVMKARGAVEVVVGKRTGWLLPARVQREGPVQELILPLAEDKALIVTGVAHFGQGDIVHLASLFDPAKAAAALDAPPRTEIKQTREMFRTMPRGASWYDVQEWTGLPTRSTFKEMRMEAADFDLADGSAVHLSFRDGKLTGAACTGKDGKTEELLK